jgi:predicted nucleic acid-binding protein
MILLDSNLLGRMTDSDDPQCAVARRAMHLLFAKGERFAIVPQNLYEFWAIATRAKSANGLGMTIEQTSQWLRFFQRRFAVLPDKEDLPARWHNLVKTLRVTGFRAHDVRLVAAAQSHGITQMLTFDAGDISGLPITIIDPASV